MISFVAKVFYICVCVHLTVGKVVDGKNSTRGSRNFDNFFNSENFAEDSNIPSEDSDEPVYSDIPAANPSRGDVEFSGFDNYKGFWKPPPNYEQTYIPVKGFPYYVPYPKGKGDLGDFGNIGFPSQNQMADMMAMMNKLQVSPKKEDQSFLSKLGSDPKSLAILAAIIPLSIMLASFIPVIINYFITGASTTASQLVPGLPSLVTSIATSRMARAFDDIETLEKLFENLVDFGAKVMEDDECIQKTVCRTVLSQWNGQTVKQVAVAVKHFSKGDFLKSWGGKEILESLEKGDCENVCMNFNRKRNV